MDEPVTTTTTAPTKPNADLIIRISNMKDKVKKAEIQTSIETLAPNATVDHKKNAPLAHIICQQKEHAEAIVKAVESLKTSLGKEISLSPLTEKESDIYWDGVSSYFSRANTKKQSKYPSKPNQSGGKKTKLESKEEVEDDEDLDAAPTEQSSRKRKPEEEEDQ